MKIVSWNCNGTFRNKFDAFKNLNVDLFIIQECEDPSKTNNDVYKSWASNYLWIGDNKNKGLGIFAKDSVKIEKLDWTNEYNDHSVKYFLPCRINQKINLLGIWAHYNNSPTFGYIGQFWKYLQNNLCNLDNTICAGDLNSNVMWDKWDRWWNHTDVINLLESKDISSVYHYFYNQRQGEEDTATFFMHKNRSKPYHIDYIFAPNSALRNINSFEISEDEIWLSLSDHRPLILDKEL